MKNWQPWKKTPPTAFKFCYKQSFTPSSSLWTYWNLRWRAREKRHNLWGQPGATSSHPRHDLNRHFNPLLWVEWNYPDAIPVLSGNWYGIIRMTHWYYPDSIPMSWSLHLDACLTSYFVSRIDLLWFHRGAWHERFEDRKLTLYASKKDILTGVFFY